MLEEDHGVMFFKLFEQAPPLLDRYGFAGGNVMKKLFEALQGGSLSLILVLLWRHLLAEGERCNTQRGIGHSFLTGALMHSGHTKHFLYMYVISYDGEICNASQCVHI